MLLHPNGECAPEICGSPSYDPCRYTVEEASRWVPSVYIVGGAGVGKSTFTAELLERLEALPLGPLRDLHAKPNAKVTVTLRGHETQGGGIYLGKMRDSFPGTDGLDRASSPTGEEWLDRFMHLEHSYIIGEGATLATERFLSALQRRTNLLLVHLVCDPEVKSQRLAERGSGQKETFVLGTATRSANVTRKLDALGAEVLEVQTDSELDWEIALDLCQMQLNRWPRYL